MEVFVLALGWLMELGLGCVILLTVQALIKERETDKVTRVLLPGAVVLLLGALLLVTPFPGRNFLLIAAEAIVALLAILFFCPNGRVEKFSIPEDTPQLDERDIMFARATYRPGTACYQDYYGRNPDKKASDDMIRSMPELCSPGTITYDPLNSTIADANFGFLADIAKYAEGEKASHRAAVDPAQMSRRLKGMARYYGAVLAGIAELKPYHFYSHRGRRPEVYGEKVESRHRYGVVFAVEMDYLMLKGAPQVQVVAESSKQYIEAAKIGMELSYYIRALGYDARNHMDANYLLVAPLVAADAGLGEIGRMGILMTEKYGPRVRLGVVTTDMPLVPDRPVSLGMQNFCNICRKCARVCPARAIPEGPKGQVKGIRRWRIDQEKCYAFWRKVGTDCAICINSCPYSKPDTLIHNITRYCLRRSQFARVAILMLDDYLYGRRPYKDIKPQWMQ